MSCSIFLARRAVLPSLSLICLALSAALPAHAEVTQWSTGQVNIEFDADTFSFTSDSHYNGPMGISPGYSQVGQGVVLNFGGLLAAYASSYSSFSSDSRLAFFNAFFNFTPAAGYAITGYTVTYEGGYFVESPGSVGLNGQSGTILLNGNVGGDSFLIDSYQGGSVAPQIAGELSASADVNYIEIFEGYEKVYSHDQEVLDYCEQDDPSVCHYRTEPVYIDQPIYRYESDLGEAQIYLSTINVQAHVTAVPEPGAVAMTLAGLASVGGWAVRRRRAPHAGAAPARG
jgi:hypothetical protein